MIHRNLTTERAIALCKHDPRPLLLRPGIQHYEWGDSSFIPELFGLEVPHGKPCAEAWLGSHPGGDTRALVEGTEVRLDALLEGAREELLGQRLAGPHGGLPFLLKILSAARPLSIQAHPTREQAEEGFSREDAEGVPISSPRRNYRDRNHKPELIVALTDLHALCGFRPAAQISRNLGPFMLSRAYEYSMPRFNGDPESLARLYGAFMRLPQDTVDAILAPVIQQLSRAREDLTPDDWRYWMLRAHTASSRDSDRRDRGLFSFAILNLVRLRPEQGLFLPAGTLHAYLEGSGVEIMASSDNVLRGGLTTKHVDVPELLRILRFDGGHAGHVEGRRIGRSQEWTYPTPAEEFKLSRVRVTPRHPFSKRRIAGPEILLVLELEPGTGATFASAGEKLALARGSAVLVPSGTSYSLTATGDTVLYRASVPVQSGARRPARRRAAGR